jgi:hypothetical protein
VRADIDDRLERHLEIERQLGSVSATRACSRHAILSSSIRKGTEGTLTNKQG